MKSLIIAAAFLFLSNQLHSQWFFQNPLPTGSTINGIHFLDENTGYLASRNFIIKTTDGGLSWSSYRIENFPMSDVFFINPSIGWCGGGKGVVYKTTDAGESWFWIASLQENVGSLVFTSELTGFAAGTKGSIFRTTDGGITWSRTILQSDYPLTGLQFLNSQTGWVGASIQNRAWTTNNGGISWSLRELPGPAVDFCFVNNNLAYAVGYDRNLMKTTNGGQWWDIIPFAYPYNIHLYGVYFADSLNGWITTGAQGGASSVQLLKTTNGGISWVKVELGLNFGALLDIVFTSASTGYIAGSQGLIHKTTNSGSTWELLTKGERENLQSAFFLNENLGWAVGNGGLVLKTTNGGETWIKKTALNVDFFSVHFISENTGFIAGYSSYTAGYSKILKTTNGGESWLDLNANGGYRCVFFINELKGWAVGAEGRVSKTTNGGTTWQTTFNPTYWTWCVYFISEDTGFMTGSAGQILKTTNAGLTWRSISLGGTNGAVYTIKFIDQLTGFAAGIGEIYPNGFISKTTDGGETWEIKATGDYVTSLSFPDFQHVYAAGNLLYYSDDQGETWHDSNAGGNAVFFVTKDVGWLVSNFGTILKTTEGPVLLPVELISFTASPEVSSVTLSWTTASELNSHSFEIERKQEQSDWRLVGYVTASGTSTELRTYSYTDKALERGKYSYRLKMNDRDGSFAYSGLTEVELNIPSGYFISQNYPNPFNPETKIEYQLQYDSDVTIELYSALGERVEILAKGSQPAGYYSINYNALKNNLPSGVYIYTIKASAVSGMKNFVQGRKMILMK